MKTEAEIVKLFAADKPIVAFKTLIKEQAEILKQQFNPHESVLELLRLKASFIDVLLTTIWKHFVENNAQNFSLLAVGGYGRRELFPYSDLDILILLDDSELESYQEKLSLFSNFLWDIGLNPGLSVRTVAESVQAAIGDQTVMTSLLEIRLIAGNNALFE
ncbi:MAG: [protein-PII] uridylyltransferase, partial [Methylococcaceae bacterium]|nr:[protein-PII] uridylyltransferase [Methylococcaceae bacterium]